MSGDEGSRQLAVSITLNGVSSLSQLSLELGDDSIFLDGGGYSLNYELPFAINSATATAKFSAKTSVLKIKAAETVAVS